MKAGDYYSRAARIGAVVLLLGATVGARAPAAAQESRTCRLAEAARSAEEHAIACAEAFIARNGYTLLPPPTDRSMIALESIEYAASLEELLRDRRGSLEPVAFAVCSPDERQRWLVAFRYSDGSSGARAVSMSTDFRDLRVEHRDFGTEVAASEEHGCRLLPIREGKHPSGSSGN
jgi:hypothetical protein